MRRPAYRAPRRVDEDRLEQVLHALRAIARDGPNEVLRCFGSEVSRLLLQLARSAAAERTRRLALAVALERLAAAEAAYRRAFDQAPTDEEVERRWRQLARAGEAARAALALEGLNAAGLPAPQESSHV